MTSHGMQEADQDSNPGTLNPSTKQSVKDILQVLGIQ